MPIIPALGRLRQEDCEFEASWTSYPDLEKRGCEWRERRNRRRR
jgi:hypothetical protein